MLPKLVPLALALLLTPQVFAAPKQKAAPAAAPGTAKAFCDAFEHAEAEAQLAACPSDAKLKEKTERAVHQCIELLNSGVSQKRQIFSASAAKGCLSAEKAFAADPTRPRYLHDAVRGACAFVVNGLVEEGKECESALDCKDGLTCVGAKGAPPGKCTQRLAAGGACDDEQLGGSRFYVAATSSRAVCGPGLHCGMKGSELVCLSNSVAGQACEPDASACGPGMRCINGRCGDETLAKAKQACAASSDCAVGLVCESQVCTETKACGTAGADPATKTESKAAGKGKAKKKPATP